MNADLSHFRRVLDCAYGWNILKESNVDNGVTNDAADLAACQKVCTGVSNCTGVDWNPRSSAGRRCWLSGPWSGRRNVGTTSGITHYDLTKACRGSTNRVGARWTLQNKQMLYSLGKESYRALVNML